MSSRTRSSHHPHAALPDTGGASLITDARLVEIYAAMLKCRMLRERIRALAGPAKLRAFAPGSEAVTAAAVIGLLPEDTIMSAVPHLFAALIRGVPLAKLLPLHVARRSVESGSMEHAFAASGLLAAAGRGAAVAHAAAGAAFAGKLGNRINVTLVFQGGAGEEPGWREIFDFAVAQALPLIFLRQASEPLQFRTRHKRGPAARSKTPPAVLPIIPVDCNDAVAVYRVACEAIAHARRGSGPTLIDCLSLRQPGERRKDSDCVARMEHYLAAKGLRPERIRSNVTAKFSRALDAASASRRRSPTSSRKLQRAR
jgi:TPP-dependent pyruvate/acetoin dehydrogenase alpha subunit